VERLAARREHGDLRRGREQLGQRGGRRSQVFEVVEHEQLLLARECVRERLGQRNPRLLAMSEPASDCRQHERRVAQRSERHERDAVRETVGELCGCVKREARLAGAAGADERQQARFGVEQLPDLRDLLRATDEPVRRNRQRDVRPQRLRCWKVGREPVGEQLVETLRLRQVLQAMGAEVEDADPVRCVVAEGRPRFRRDEDLPAVCRAHDPCGAVDVQPGVKPFCDDGLAGVDPDPDAERTRVGERALTRDGGADGVAGARKREVEAIALHLDLDTAAPTEGVAQQPAVLLERVDVCVPSELLQQARRALDVREEHRDRAAGELCRRHRRGPSVRLRRATAKRPVLACTLASVSGSSTAVRLRGISIVPRVCSPTIARP
jgi:hypothetical protein